MGVVASEQHTGTIMRANYHTLTVIIHPKHTQLASALTLPLCHDTQALEKFRTKDAHAAEKGKKKNKSRESEVGGSEEWTPGTEQGTKRKKTVIFFFSRSPFFVSHTLTRVRSLSRSLSRLLFLSCPRILCRKMDNVPRYSFSRILTNTHRVIRLIMTCLSQIHPCICPPTYAYICRQEASDRYDDEVLYTCVSVCVRTRVCLYVHTCINT